MTKQVMSIKSQAMQRHAPLTTKNDSSSAGGRMLTSSCEKSVSIIYDDMGDAVVEATIIFPLIIMVFAALVFLAIYLPTYAALQYVTQYTATALATQQSDTWLILDDTTISYRWITDRNSLPSVYVAMFSGGSDISQRGEDIIRQLDGRILSAKTGELDISCYMVNYFVYKEVVAIATREYVIPVNLSIIGFPETIEISVTSTAVVQNGDEFIRNMDLATDFLSYIGEKFGLTNISESIESGYRRVADFMGW